MNLYLLINAILLIVMAGGIIVIYQYYHKRLNAEVERAQKSENLKGIFLANISHALRTPLNAIIGFSDVILNDKQGELKREQINEMVTHINKNGQQLLYFVSQLLELSAYEGSMLTFSMIEVNLAELMASYRREILRDVEPEVSVRIRTDLSPHTKATLDTNLMRQLVMHLMQNAAKHTHQGSITLEYGRERNGMEVKVTDTGEGVPEKLMGNLFSMLHNEDSLTLNERASGLGLSICKSILEALHGEIDITSEEGKGTVARVWFPCRMKDMKRRTAQ
jgi:signal transduction histidine kinase